MEYTNRPAATMASPPVSEAAPLRPVGAVSATNSPINGYVVDAVLRVLLFAAAISAVVVLATSKQTVMVSVPGPGLPRVPVSAKFNHSTAFVYLMTALSVTGLYSIITTLVLISLVLKPSSTKAILLIFALFDVVFVGIVASATGAAGGVAYIGLRGNSHLRWNKISGIYDRFIRHIASAVALAGISAILLVCLTVISTFRLYKRIP